MREDGRVGPFTFAQEYTWGLFEKALYDAYLWEEDDENHPANSGRRNHLFRQATKTQVSELFSRTRVRERQGKSCFHSRLRRFGLVLADASAPRRDARGSYEASFAAQDNSAKGARAPREEEEPARPAKKRKQG